MNRFVVTPVPISSLTPYCESFENILLGKTTCTDSWLYDTLMKEKIINPVQIGFVENHRATDHILTLKSIISKHVSATRQGKIYACFVDFKNAHDTVWNEDLLTKLSKVNIKGQFLKLIQSLYKQSCCAVKIGKFRTEFMLCEKGVRQGCPLSPILFNLFINDLLSNLHHTNPNAVKLKINMSCLC